MTKFWLRTNTPDHRHVNSAFVCDSFTLQQVSIALHLLFVDIYICTRRVMFTKHSRWLLPENMCLVQTSWGRKSCNNVPSQRVRNLDVVEDLQANARLSEGRASNLSNYFPVSEDQNLRLWWLRGGFNFSKGSKSLFAPYTPPPPPLSSMLLTLYDTEDRTWGKRRKFF